jgi:hypothetical protein
MLANAVSELSTNMLKTPPASSVSASSSIVIAKGDFVGA